MNQPLDAYQTKRDFSKTPEPRGRRRKAKAGNSYVIQKHAARRLHYDFRLELDGVLKSWAVPEGPSLVPGEKRLAVQVEDHPLEYGEFEGVIPKGEYGAGTVMIWDRGTWVPEFDPEFGYRKGHLKFQLAGEKLAGLWHLVRMAPKPREKQPAWLLFKSEDAAARSAGAPDILLEMPRSVTTGRTMEEITRDQDRVWSPGQGEITRKPASRRRRKPVLNPANLPKANPGELPSFVAPCLPSTADKAPSGADWLHEIKYDGYRVQLHIADGRVTVRTRQGLDWTERFETIAKAAAVLPLTSGLIDGEIVAQTETGIASFRGLVEALRSGAGNLAFYAFDLLFVDGFDLRDAPLAERKAALGKLLAANGDHSHIRFSEHLGGDGDAIFRHACRLGLEGLVSKRAAAPYRSGRVKTWLKVKCAEHRPFVVAGFIPSTVAKNAVGALVLGEYAAGRLVPSGHVGTGFSADEARELFQKLNPLSTNVPAVKDELADAKKARWVEPVLVAEIEYRGRTGSARIWHAVYKGLVEGGEPKEVVRPAAAPASGGQPSNAKVKLTNPARLLWPEEGITKQGLADFYTEIADWILPHIQGRPLSLVRCPGGVHEACFFQKHAWAGLGQAVRLVPVPGENEPMLAIDGLAGLLELVQASVLEIHPWGSTVDRPERPDRMTIDLDPAEDVSWERVIEAAFDVRKRLAELGLQGFVKTTGGKGLHIVAPLAAEDDWEAVQAFVHALAKRMATEQPERYVATMAKAARRGRIYVDYLRNRMGATAVAAYSTRARPGAAVSVPLAWDELGPGIRSNHFTVENLPKRLAVLDSDPWDAFFSLRQRLAVSNNASPRTRKRGTKTSSPSVPDEHVLRLLPGAVPPPVDALTAYWQKVANQALHYLGRRPLQLVRHVAGTTFYHRGPLSAVPDAVREMRIAGGGNGQDTWPWVDSLEGILGLVSVGAVELHPWGAAIDDIEHPDTLVFDLEPGEGVPWQFVVETAFRMRELLRTEALESWPKLTGGIGLHVMVPVEPELDWKEAQSYSRDIAERLAASAPDRYLTSAARGKTVGRLIVDGHGTTAVGAYSPRARPGFPVAAPVSWLELERGVTPDEFTIVRSPRQSRRRSDSNSRRDLRG